MGVLYRKVHKLMPGTAGELLYMPRTYGGLGCQMLQDKVFTSKWATLQRTYLSCSSRTAGVMDLVQRSNRMRGVHVLPGQGARILYSPGLFVSGMLEAASEVGLYLHCGGPRLQGTSYEQIRAKPNMFTEEEQIILGCEDIITIGDLTMSLDGSKEYF